MDVATTAADAATAIAASTTATAKAAAKTATSVTLTGAAVAHTAVAAKALTEAAAVVAMAAAVTAAHATTTAASVGVAVQRGTYAPCKSLGTRRKIAWGPARCSRSRGPEAATGNSDSVKAGATGRRATGRRRLPRRLMPQMWRSRTYTPYPSQWHPTRRYRRSRRELWRPTGGT